MNILIIEDEPSNERHLRRLLETVLPDTGTVVSTDSVRSSVDLLSGRDFRPDLVFADIQLSDGLCFDIFDRIDEPFPVIFTTAYDSYALKAFEYNALSYLQKPVTEHDLRAALSRISRESWTLGISYGCHAGISLPHPGSGVSESRGMGNAKLSFLTLSGVWWSSLPRNSSP